MRVGITTVQVPFVRGGAELHAEGLRAALVAAGHEAEIISVPFKWYPPEALGAQILACRLLDIEESSGMRIDRVVGLKFPGYLIPHPNKVLWILHQHRSAYDLWENHYGDLYGVPYGAEAREIVRGADRKLIPEARAVYANSRNVAERLRRFSGLEATPLYHPPPDAEAYHCGEAGDFFVMPSRINEPKRQDLVIEALFRTRNPVRVCFTGAADDLPFFEKTRLRAAALPGDRVAWLGAVPAARKVELLAGCLGVIYPPFDEDYGYVTLEAMLSSKPVVTCADSGGPLEFVEDGETGFVVAPEPGALAEALDRLWEDRARAARFGRAGRARYDAMGIAWDKVVECLLA